MSAPTTAEWLRTAVVRVGEGSGRLALHCGRRAVARARGLYTGCRDWVGESAGGLDKAFRLAVLAVAVLIVRKTATAIGRWAYGRIESGAWWPLLFGAAAVWIVCAYRAGRPGWTPKPPKTKPASAAEAPTVAESSAEAESPEPEPPVSLEKPQPYVPSPIALVAAVRDVGTPHAQLKPLAEHLRTTTDAVRTAAAGMGWAVKDVRMQGRSASAGLRWDEVPSPEQAYPDSSVVGAGQPADDNDDDADHREPEKGLRVERIGLPGTVVRDPADVIRHHKITD